MTVTNICVPNNKPSKYLKQSLTELKREIESSTVMVGDFSTTFNNARTPDRINKEIKDLNNTVNQLNLADTQTLYPTRAEYTIFSSEHGAFSSKNYRLGHKTNKYISKVLK